MIRFIKKYSDKKIIIILLVTYTAYRIVTVLSNIILKLISGDNPNAITWEVIFFNSFFLHLISILPFIPFIAIITKYLIVKESRKSVIFMVHFILAILFKPLGFLIPKTIIIMIQGNAVDLVFYKKYVMNFIYFLDINFLVYFSLVAITYMYYTFEKFQTYKVREAELKMELTNSKLKVLKSQLQPHFMFNTLNSIYSLIDINIEKSKNIILDLGDILRDILNKKDDDFVEVQDELIILRKFLNIKKVRFEDHLNYDITVEEGVETCLLPTLIIQQIIENAIKHGYSSEHNSLYIKLSIEEKEQCLYIRISNNGKPLAVDFNELLNKGNGLYNINERLKMLYGNDFIFQMKNENQSVRTLIIIPTDHSVFEVA